MTARPPAAAYRLAPFAPGEPGFREGVAVYARTWGRSAAAAEFQMRGHAAHPGWRGVIARVSGPDEVVAFGYGTAARPGQWWHDRVAGELAARKLDLRPLERCWVLTELAVLPGHRDAGLGARLHSRLLAGLPQRRAALSTQSSNTAAQRFYARHGWRVLVPTMAFTPGDEPFTILGLELSGR